MSLILKNSSSYAGKEGGTDWWNWTAYVECTPPDSLGDIAYVEYHLHPTFRNPIRRIHQPSGGFALETSGWGVFEVRAKVVFKDQQRKPMMLKHFLHFEDTA